ncbi:GNAT family N-acetyltransferase [Streptomyces gobitricini]|uniref:N-acetyltransferase domain-containing protein n=1 Tax=Streptomyces gobitricini TaxID=68211 RepID=A0ABN3L102_9ACTN
MGWRHTHDVEEFRREAGPYLEADPARNTALLTVSETVLRYGPRPYGDDGGDARFGWWRRTPAGPVEGAFVWTPPKDPLFGPMPDEAARRLARVLRGTADVRGVKGGDGPAQAFAAEWTGGDAYAWRVVVRSRLFRLGDLAPPRPAPPGTARRATAEDVPLVAAWMRAFAADIGDDPAADQTGNAARRVAHGGLYLWETGGRPVSMAAHSPLVAGQSRVSPVYTPPASRGRGYAGAATAAVSRAAREAGARQVLLFADVADPTSTALYQRLGYHPVADHVDVEIH